MDAEQPAASPLIKLERQRRGWSQSELAQRLGTTQVNVSRWETGSNLPGPYLRQKLAEVFGKSLEALGLVQEIRDATHEEVASADNSAPGPVIQHVQRWNIPYHRNSFFTGREEILLHLYTILNTSNTAALTQTQAISGLGGIGKTQIAVEYAYRFREHYSAVLWVSASSRDAFISDFVMLASFLDLPEKSELDQDIVVSAVKRWLSTNTDWLLIVDNVDDLQIIVEFLPTLSMGKVLLTTRLQALGSVARGIEVEKMESDEGKLFLLRRTGTLAQDESLEQSKEEYLSHAADIVTALDALPLALDQAGAYIEETRCGLTGYLVLYQARRKELLQRRGHLPTNHPEPVAATWSLSFQQVEERLPAAADLLRLLAFLGPEAIPEEILTDGAAELGPELGPAADDPLRLNETIRLLLGYSLIRRNAEDRSLSIHRLVQAVLKDGMSSEVARDWAERAIRAINRAFPKPQTSTWEHCKRCLPHVFSVMPYLNEYHLVFQEFADLLNKAATYLTDHAQYALAEPLLTKALTIREETTEGAHPDLARTLNDLGALYLDLGKYRQAEPMLLQALNIRRQQLGSEHSDTATSLINLAKLYSARGQYGQAEEYFQASLRIRETVLPPDHPDIALSLNYLAELYTVQARFEQAESLYVRALAMQKEVLGNLHPDVAKILNNLASLYRKKGVYSQAEQYHSNALDIQRQILREDHPDIAETFNNLGRLYRAQGDYLKAEPRYQEALAIREHAFGLDHPLVAKSRYDLAKLYQYQGKYLQAEELCKQALRIQERTLGKHHPDIANTLDTLAELYLTKDRHAESEQLYQRALSIRTNALGMDHPDVALVLNALGEVYLAQEKFLEARSLIKQSLEIRERTLGQEHPYIAYNLMNMAETFRLEGSFAKTESLRKQALAEAIRFYRKALAIREKGLNPEHPNIATTLHKLAVLYYVQGHYDLAEPLFSTALAIREKALAQDHPDLQDTLEYLSGVLSNTNRETLAAEFERRAQVIKSRRKRKSLEK
jgi:tetratricopeptide (TPR) repeat protein/transcriptional regulator with XRE-family HTH domain